MQEGDEVAAHLEDHDRDGQGGGDPEAAGHVGKFRAGTGVGGDGDRLESHPADRARPRTGTADLGVHRARPLGNVFVHVLVARGRVVGVLWGREEAGRVALEAVAATLRAEVVWRALVIEGQRRVGIDLHPAHRVGHGMAGLGDALVVLMVVLHVQVLLRQNSCRPLWSPRLGVGQLRRAV